MAVLWKRKLKEVGLYEWGQWQGRVKMIGVVEASIEIDGTVRGRLVPLVASLGNGCTFLRIKIILHKTQLFALSCYVSMCLLLQKAMNGSSKYCWRSSLQSKKSGQWS